jgi:ubiquinol-cytochrome c reductase cytochrome c subunit
MRARLLALMLCLAALALSLSLAAPAARAATPGGVVRPTDEDSLSQRELGSQLFAGNCSSCHGSRGEGVMPGGSARGVPTLDGAGPSLKDAGALAADFYLRNGYMPLSSPDEQPSRSRPLFNDREIKALVAYVASLGDGPPIPKPDPKPAQVGRGMKLFTEHCAGCHQVVAEGGVLSGARAPALKGLTNVQIAEAVRTGPYVMPRFSPKSISDDDLNAIIAYVQASNSPDDRGGWGIGHLGPFPEGMVAWIIAGFVLVGVCLILGKRVRG